MKKSEYKAYLQSAEWREKRNEAFEYHGSFCNRCDLPRWLAELVYDQDLHVHHVSYASRGDEDLDDLEILCARCHELETFGRSELRAPKESICEACGYKHWDYRSRHCQSCDQLRTDLGQYLERLNQPNTNEGGSPYWGSFLRMMAIRESWSGKTPEQIGKEFAEVTEMFVRDHVEAMGKEIPF